jgi:hypothetical protein
MSWIMPKKFPAPWVSSSVTSSWYHLTKNQVEARNMHRWCPGFSNGGPQSKAEEIVKLMSEHHDSAPKAARETAEHPASDAIHPDEKPMAQWNIRQWALKVLCTRRPTLYLARQAG